MKAFANKPVYAFWLCLLLAAPLQVSADNVGDQLNEARLEGQLWAAYALNEHLSAFDIDIEVSQSEAILSGQVEEDVQKDLAEQVALGMDGIERVDNRIEVAGDEAVRREDGEERTFGDRISDATTTATVKSKLLWNRNTGGLAINVSTEGGEVLLEGEADSDASKALAERLAANTDGVQAVDNRIRVTDGDGNEDERGVDDIVSDTWITTKVQSTLIFTTDVPARHIGVETTDGVVTLDGEVQSAAIRDLAIELAADVRGVREVNADALQVADG